MSRDPAFAINHELKKMGLATLNEAAALFGQMAMLIRDDRQFRSMLNACEPAERRHMYDALAPNLRFEARPFEMYLIDLAQEAEREQLPTITADGGLAPFKVPEIETRTADDEAATAAARIEKQRLAVVCLLCTREAMFTGETKQEVVDELRKAGWRPGVKNANTDHAEAVEICPKCVKARAPRMVRA